MINKIKISKIFKISLACFLIINLVILGIPVTCANTIPDVEKVEVNDIEIIELASGKIEYVFNPDTGENDLSYYKYSYVAFDYTVTFTDGTVLESDESGDIRYNNHWFWLEYTDDQSYDNQWGLGPHEVTGEIFGFETTFIVNIIESPIDAVNINNLTIEEGTHGTLHADYNPETDENDLEWYKYDYNDLLLDFSVILKDGTVLTSSSNGLIEYDGEWYDAYPDDDQSYNNQWGLGVHEVPVYIMGYKSSVLISIVDSPVASVVVDNIELINGTHGEFVTAVDKQTGEEAEWFKYDYSSLITYEVTLLDGSILYSYPDGSVEYNDEWYFIDISDDQSYENEWQEGAHQLTATIGGCSTTFTITILPSPIESIEIDDIYNIENQNGFYTTDIDPITGEESPQWYCYNYLLPSYTVTLKDGTVLTSNSNGEITLDHSHYIIHLTDDQSYDNQWEIGLHKAKAEIIGFETYFNVYVIDSPVVDVSIDDVQRIENTGTWKTDSDNNNQWYQYTYDVPNAILTLDDGSTIESEDGYVHYKGQYYCVDITDDQSPDNKWGKGAHTVTATVMGKSTTFDVIIVETPVEKIIIDDLNLQEGIDGYYVVDYNPESEQYNMIWFKYYYSHDAQNNFKIILKDGTVLDIQNDVDTLYAVPYVYYNGQRYPVAYTDDQSNENQWHYGTYTAKATILGFTTDFNINVIKEQDPDTECYGDINFDGLINIIDSTEIQKQIVSMKRFTDRQMIIADVNADGEVNVIDVTLIQKYIAGLPKTELVGVLAILVS